MGIAVRFMGDSGEAAASSTEAGMQIARNRSTSMGRKKGAAITGARKGLDKLPEEIRQRIPEDLRVKISGH